MIETLKHCHTFFPIIKILLQIFGTIPVTIVIAEKSFSSLSRLTNYMSSNMCQERLNGLAVLNIHNEIPVNNDGVVNIFSRTSRRNKDEDRRLVNLN